MKITRRSFLAALAAFGASSCARARNLPLIEPLVGGEKGPFTVAAINDLHILDARSTALANFAVRQINATENVRFIVALGDLSTSGRLGELKMAKESLDRLECPYVVVPGNHDIEPGVKNGYANYVRFFERGNWVRAEKPWAFIGLDSCEGGESDVAIRPDRIEWLQAQIKSIGPDRPIGLFCHHPFNPNSKAYRVKNADEVLALFAGHKLKFVAAGHYHGNQVEEKDGILFATTACCTATRDNFDGTPAKGYRLFHFDGDAVTTEFIEVKP